MITHLNTHVLGLTVATIEANVTMSDSPMAQQF